MHSSGDPKKQVGVVLGSLNHEVVALGPQHQGMLMIPALWSLP